jgi:hypothetical protein
MPGSGRKPDELEIAKAVGASPQVDIDRAEAALIEARQGEDAMLTRLAATLIGAAVAVTLSVSPAFAENVLNDELAKKLSCRDLIDAGWKNMPDVVDYVLAKPGANKLGYGSECHIGSLVFSQCWLEPRWSVKKAVDELVYKAVHNKRLPETPVCGA